MQVLMKRVCVLSGGSGRAPPGGEGAGEAATAAGAAGRGQRGADVAGDHQGVAGDAGVAPQLPHRLRRQRLGGCRPPGMSDAHPNSLTRLMTPVRLWSFG